MLEESWRRTWWFLYVTDGIFAGISHCLSRFKLTGSGYTATRDRLRLGLGAIKALGGVWAIGSTTVEEVQVIAREMLSLRDPTDGVVRK